MPLVAATRGNFTGGEIDPRMYARVDTELYQKGLARARNILITVQGGWRTRPGTTVLRDLERVAGRPDWEET